MIGAEPDNVVSANTNPIVIRAASPSRFTRPTRTYQHGVTGSRLRPTGSGVGEDPRGTQVVGSRARRADVGEPAAVTDLSDAGRVREPSHGGQRNGVCCFEDETSLFPEGVSEPW